MFSPMQDAKLIDALQPGHRCRWPHWPLDQPREVPSRVRDGLNRAGQRDSQWP